MTKSTILVCMAHPDDEALACGGVMARHANAGDRVHVCFMADGVFSRDRAPDGMQTELQERRRAAVEAAEILGAEPPRFFDLPDQRLDTVPLLEITQHIERYAAEIGPHVVYTHHFGDLNLDHRRVSQAVMTAFRPTPGQSVRQIYGCETLSSSEWVFGSRESSFRPTRFVDIGATLERKLAALDVYSAEMRDFPHPRSTRTVEALASLRGATAGLHAAEAFTVLREVVTSAG